MPFPNPSTQFKPGNPGGPGRPSRPLTDRAAIALEETKLGGKALPPGVTVADLVVLGWLKKAMQGDAAARKDLLDRLEGKLTEKLEVGGLGAAPADSADTRRAVADPVLAEMMCALDERLAAPPAGDEPGRVRPQGEPGEVGVPAAPGAPEP